MHKFKHSTTLNILTLSAAARLLHASAGSERGARLSEILSGWTII